MNNSSAHSTIKLALALSSLLTLAACETHSPPLTGPVRPAEAQIEYKGTEVSADGLTVEYDSRVDILFIIDDSRSMKNHQKNLSQNIHRFVESIAKVGAIDFHIGYTVSHDSTRYGSVVPRTCPDGKVNWEDPGALRPLKGPEELLPKDGRRFVTNQDDFKVILQQSLDPEINTDLVKDLVDPDPAKPEICASGPELEEFFTPLLGSITDQNLMATTNKNFRREGAFFVAVIVSDAKDASGITPESVALQIAKATGSSERGRQKFRVFSVAFPPGMEIGTATRLHNSCKPDPAFKNPSIDVNGKAISSWPQRHVIGPDENPLAVLASLTEDENSDSGGQVLSICSNNYGESLAKFGTQIRQDALRDLTLELPRRWEITADPNKDLKVKLGEVELIEETLNNQDVAQWRRNEGDVSVTIYGQKINWEQYPGAKIQISYTPALDSKPTTLPYNKDN